MRGKVSIAAERAIVTVQARCGSRGVPKSRFVIGFAIDQDKIGPDMAVPMIGPFTGKRVIDVNAGQGLVNGKQIHNLHQGSINDAILP